jgi:hypothetical protein
MNTLTKFVCGCVGVGAVLVLGYAVLQMPVASGLSNELGFSSGGAFLQTATGGAGLASQRAISEFTANIQYLTDSGSRFLVRNGASAGAELQGMASSASARLVASGLLPASAAHWFQSSAETKVATAGQKPNRLTRKVPVSKAALHASGRSVASVRQPASSDAGF